MVENGEIIAKREIRIANTPKSDGEYILVRIGVASNNITWDMSVPDVSCRMFLNKLISLVYVYMFHGASSFY